MTTAVQVATSHGIKIADIAWRCSQAEGVPYYVVCSLLMQETGGGLNIWGHDGGAAGWYSGAGIVTETAYKAYKIGRQQGKGMQGCGPCQLTYWSIQDEADALGGCWVPEHNVTVGLRTLKGHYSGSWVDAARAYNGSGPAADAYAQQMAGRFTTWKALLAGAGPPGGHVTTAYTRITVQGTGGPVVINDRTRQMLAKAEGLLGYKLSIIQGSYHTSTSASAGTHDGGGAVDLVPYDWEHKVHAMRAVGFAAWHRPAIPGLWGEHIHAIALGDTEASPAAKAQMVDYGNHRDGLADNAVDNTWHPDPIPVYHYQAAGATPQPPASDWSTGDVYVDKLHAGQTNSDSVSRLRYRLTNHDKIPAATKPGLGNDYGPAVVKASAYWQSKVAPQIKGPTDGKSWSNPQASALFGPAYKVVLA